MKVSIDWLKELVDLNVPLERLINLLPLRSVSTKEVTESFIELDMKGYNRADLLSMRGVALEIAAITGSKLNFNDPQDTEFIWDIIQLPTNKIKVENPKLCPFYTITKIAGLKVGKSSPDIVKKLEESGMRSVDNITDITNLIMLEYGQPLHAFDAKAVKDENIIVRTAKKSEQITTLDGKIRNLEESDLLIADSEKALGLAGIMGGKDSEINETTNTIFLEAAIFDPINIRKTATRLGFSSEASKRFQHGLTKKRLLQALNAAIKMYEKLGGKLIAISLVGDFKDQVRKITLTKKKLEELVGINFEEKKVEEYLQSLGFTLVLQDKALHTLEVVVPYYRLDIELEEDLIEEVARMYGYEKIPPQEVLNNLPFQKEDPIFQTISDLRNKLVKLGLTEIQSYSFYSTQVQNALGFSDLTKKVLVKLENPMSLETQYLRQNIWPNLLEVVGRNMRKGYKDIGIFEIGKAFSKENDEPKEDLRLAIALMNGTDSPLEELISIAEDLGIEFKKGSLPTVAASIFHPKRFLAFEKDGKQTGSLAEVHLRVLNKLGIEKRVAILEVEITAKQ